MNNLLVYSIRSECVETESKVDKKDVFFKEEMDSNPV